MTVFRLPEISVPYWVDVAIKIVIMVSIFVMVSLYVLNFAYSETVVTKYHYKLIEHVVFLPGVQDVSNVTWGLDNFSSFDDEYVGEEAEEQEDDDN